MPRKQKTIHYLYKTTCIITGRYYIGMHSTCNLNDGYMGSGKRLRYSIRKYGVENHVKEILEFFESRELLVEAEKKIVNKELLSDINCMNLCVGGEGGRGFTPNEQRMNAIKSNEKQKMLRLNQEWKDKKSKKITEKLIELYSNGKRDRKYFFNWNNRKHSDTTKEKMSQSKKGVNTGELNSQYGTMWITNGIENRKIKKEDIIPEDWYKGRK